MSPVSATVQAVLGDPARLRALERTALLDSAAEPRFDEIAALAAEMLDAPVALVSLVTADRQFFKSCLGLPEPWASARETPLSHSFCQHVVARHAELVIEDAREHPLVRESLAIPDLRVVAYAGVPLVSPDGHVLGSFCVMDDKPRRWSERDLRLVRALAGSVSQQIALHESGRAARSQLRELETSYRRVVDALDEIVFSVDPAGRWTYLSSAWTRVTGFAVEDSLGRAFLDYVLPADRAENDAALQPVIRGEAEEYQHLMRYVRADGSVRWLGARGRAVRGAAGELVGLIGALNDVTARVAAEHLVRERDEELARARKLEAVGRLAAGIAHDFNNLLTAVSAHAQFLGAELGAGHAGQPDVAEIHAAVRRGEALTRQLLAVSSRQPMRLERVDVNVVVQEMTRLLGRVLGSGVRVDTALAPGLPTLLVDRSQLEQVLLNLLVNARDAMPGGGEVLVATEPCTLPDGRPAVCLLVRDTGTGMDAVTMAHVFEPFFTTKQPGLGTGLGLATVYGIVKQWDGRVDVESAPGRGATFRVQVPAE